jgi:hypothetical protein
VLLDLYNYFGGGGWDNLRQKVSPPDPQKPNRTHHRLGVAAKLDAIAAHLRQGINDPGVLYVRVRRLRCRLLCDGCVRVCV